MEAEVGAQINANWDQQCKITEKLFNTLLPKFNSKPARFSYCLQKLNTPTIDDRLITYQVLEGMMTNAQVGKVDPVSEENKYVPLPYQTTGQRFII